VPAVLPTGFIPPDDLSQTQVTLTLPPGSTFEADAGGGRAGARTGAEEPAREAGLHRRRRRRHRQRPLRRRRRAEVRKATLTINMTPRSERGGLSKQAVEGSCARRWRDCRRARQGRLRRLEREVRAVLAGEDGRVLAEHAPVVERELRTLPGIGNVTSSASLVRPELVVRPDFARAADLGVTSAAIADTLRIATAGDYDQAWPSST
jgi:multidrug efflux pump subunit AcrB